MSELKEYRYGGARALVTLHEREMRQFVETWKRAQAMDVALPETDDPDYASLETLLWHVLACAGSYMIWICRVLELPTPGIRQAPAKEEIAAEAEAFLEHVLERWRTPLAEVSEDACYQPEYPSNWETRYCIDAMLEHAVMHPIRHRYQLEELMASG